MKRAKGDMLYSLKGLLEVIDQPSKPSGPEPHHVLRVFRETEIGSWVRHKTQPVWVQEGGTG